jgi:hypothetical protein
LIVDIQHHPLSEFLVERKHPHSELIKNNRDNIQFIFPYQVENYVSRQRDDVIFFTSTDYFKEPITEDCKDFIKNILHPNDSFQEFKREKCKSLPYFTYNVLHYRLGDDEMVRHNINQHMNFYLKSATQEQNKIKENGSNVVFMSDSQELKKEIKISEVFMFDTEIGHTGYHKEKNALRDSLFELFIMTQANHIKTFTVNNWPSGFVKIAHDVYDVPFDCVTCFHE